MEQPLSSMLTEIGTDCPPQLSDAGAESSVAVTTAGVVRDTAIRPRDTVPEEASTPPPVRLSLDVDMSTVPPMVTTVPKRSGDWVMAPLAKAAPG